MRILHLSDLHLGKQVNGFSMLEDQKYILRQILNIAAEKEVETVLLCGDIYDRSVPPAEAVSLFDHFLTRLAEKGMHVLLISGNHDSAERLEYGAELLKSSRIHIASVFRGTAEKVVLRDRWGEICFHLLPFIKPSYVRALFPDDSDRISSYEDAVRFVLDREERDDSARHILLAHQNVTGASLGGSEELPIGGLDNIDASVFSGFDYVALGHIHKPQNISGRTEKERIRYCGAPLAYHIGEADTQKTLTIVEILEKSIETEEIRIMPLRRICKIRGTYEELASGKFYRDLDLNDYYTVTLTDEEDVPNAMARLKSIYPGIMQIGYDNIRTSADQKVDASKASAERSPEELLNEFYFTQNNKELGEEQRTFIRELAERIWEEDR